MSDGAADAVRTGAGDPSAPVAELRALGCGFPDGTQALREITVAVRRGEILAVMGRTGAGKSTLLKCLGGVIPALESATLHGERWLFGRRADAVDPVAIAGRIGLVFQDFEAQLFSTNVALEVGFGLDQLGLAPAEIRRRTELALARVGLAAFGRRDPATLSGGEKQRLAMAAIWALEPELVLLDEPTTDIDPLGKQAIFDLLSAFRDAGAAVVVVEHEPAAAVVADRLLLLEDGRVRALGASAELMRDVALLEACGVRPRDLDVVAAAAGIDRRLADVDDAERTLRARLARGDGSPAAAGCAADNPRPSSETQSPAPVATAGRGAPLLEVERVRHVYAGGIVALDGVSLSIAAGEFVALVGQNGSGKTTLAKHLNGLLAPGEGRVRVDGVDARELSIGRIARTVGFVFQDPDHQLFGATVEEEVAYGPLHLALDPAEVERRVAHSLGACGLADRRALDPFLLSKGERQRLAIAAVLALEPRVLLLDEPTTGLDHREQRAVLELLRDLNRAGTTIVAITHAPWLVAEFAERAILMLRGRIAFDGPVARLFDERDLLAESSFALPEATALGLRFGIHARSAGELAGTLGLRKGSDRR